MSLFWIRVALGIVLTSMLIFAFTLDRFQGATVGALVAFLMAAALPRR